MARQRQRLDYSTARPVRRSTSSIHWGYWQMRHKNSFRFVVQGALQQGVQAALIEGTPAPQACLCRIAVAWHCRRAPAGPGIRRQRPHPAVRLVGGRASSTALGLDGDGVVGGLGISGIYVLEPRATPT